MKWEKCVPTEEGLYLYKIIGQWPVYLTTVRIGDWRLAENPAWLYAAQGRNREGIKTSMPIHSMEGYSAWLGPLPDYDA